MQLEANINFVMLYSITFSKHNILIGASNASGWVYNTLEEIFSDSKMISDLLHLRYSGSLAFTYSTIRRSSENTFTLDSGFKISGEGTKTGRFLFLFFKFTSNLCVKTEKRIWNKLF